MLIDGINLVEGSKITNLTVATGTSFPANPNAGELFYRTDTTTLYVHNGTTWEEVGSGSGGTPGGNDTEVQFNDGGIFGGDAQLTWNKTTNVLTINGNSVLTSGSTIGISQGGTGLTAEGTANQVLGVQGDGSGLEYKSISGTTNQVSVTHGANSITLATPQNLHTGAQPTFAQVTVGSDPDQELEVATKQYVDSVAAGLDPKQSVRAATTGIITLSGTQTIDTVSVIAGNRVLVKNQTPATANGIYVVASGAWSRSADMDGTPANEVSGGNFVFVEQGSVNAGSGWVVTGNGTLTVGVDDINWTQFSGAGSITAGNGLTKTGNQIDVGTASSARVVVNADSIDLATVTDSGTGSFKKVTVDSYGRVTGTTNVVAGDVTGLVNDTYVNVSGDTMTGVLQLPAGSASAPSVNFGDAGSGVYKYGTNQIGLAINGVTHTRYLANNTWSISETGTFAISSQSYSATNSHLGAFDGYAFGGTPSSPSVIGASRSLARFGGGGYDGSLLNRGAEIIMVATGAWSATSHPTDITFSTTPTDGSSAIERMRITSSGAIGIGTTSLTGYNLRNGKTLTGATSAYGIACTNTIQSDVTVAAKIFQSNPGTQSTAFTLGSLYHYHADQAAIGSGSDVTNQYGFVAESTLVGATNNYGFYGAIPTGTNRWNLYMSGTASNHINGTLLLGTATDNGTDKLQVSGTAVVTAPSSGANNTQVPTTAWVRTYASGAYQPLDADLTSIAGLSGTSGFLKKTAADTWTLDTNTYSTTSHDHSGTYQPLDSDLTAIAGITREAGALIIGGASAWEKLAPETPGPSYNLQLSGTTLSWTPVSSFPAVPENLTDLSDFPSGYNSGDGGKFIRVKATEDGVEFTAAPYTKSEVDALVTGLDFKASVRAATTGSNITLSGTQTIDTVSLIAGDRVLVKDQSTGSQNGIYVVASGGWSRATDADASAEVTGGMYVFVNEGSTNADTGWVLTTNDPITLDTTALTFTQFNGLGQVTAGAGLTKTGNQLDVGTASTSRIVVNADNIDLATVTDSGTGSFKKITTDSYGRVTGTTNVVAGDITGLVDHGTIGGLSDDDHTQYLLASGTRAATTLVVGSGSPDASIDLLINANQTGATTTSGVISSGVVQSDVTGSAHGFRTGLGTQATTFTLGSLHHYRARQGTIGAGSTVTSQYGFTADDTLSGATTNYGFYGSLATGWNLYMGGAAPNYINSSLGIAASSLTGFKLRIAGSHTGAVSPKGVSVEGTVQSDATTAFRGFYTNPATAAASFTLPSIAHYEASQGTIGAGSTVTTQYGYLVNANLVGATNNYGFYGNIPAAANRWNLYMGGTANNYLGGSLGIGTTSLTGYRVAIGGTMDGAATGVGVYNYATVGNDVTHAYGFRCGLPVASGTALTQLHYYRAQQDTFTGTAASQYGFSVSSNLTGATNNYAFNGELAAAANTYNLHMSGTANNYLNGSVGVGTTALTGMTLRLGKALTGAADVYSVISSGAIQSDATSSARIFTSQVYTQAASFTCPHVYHYIADQGALGAGSAITNQYGFAVGTTLTGATNNYGFYGSIAAGTGRWNLYMGGSAINYLNGTLLIGTTTDNGTDKLQVSGTAAVTAPDSAANNTQVPTTAWVRTYASGAYQPLDADLTAIAGLSGTSGFLKKTAADTWTLDTNTYSTTSHDHSGAYQPLDAQLTDIAGLTPTKGNLIVGDGTNFISVGVGTNDYVLTADDTTASGVAWAAASGGGTGDTSATPNTLAQRDASADLYAANFVSTSDERLKENVKPIENALDKVMQLDGKMFNFIGSDKTQLGLIAQEVEKVVPEVVNTNDEGYKSVNYPVLVALLVEAIKELARR